MTARQTAALAALALLTAAIVAAAPLLTYAATLALLGFAHVVVELRYVRDRFGGRLVASLWWTWGALLVLLVAIRASGVAGLPLALAERPVELHLLALLLLGAFDGSARGAPLDGAFLGIGAAADHHSAFLPPGWRPLELAPRLFAMAVYLQCAHYFVVLHVLPRLTAAPPAAPPAATHAATHAASGRWWRAAAIAVALLLLLRFTQSFAAGRALYGIAAAVHAFLEWPLLLVAAASAASVPGAIRSAA